MASAELRRELGGSFPVANVQALASTYSGDIPLRFVRPELHSEQVLVDETLQIPTIDMRKLMVDDDDDDDEMGKLHLACKEWGFFQVLIHDFYLLDPGFGIFIKFLLWAASLFFFFFPMNLSLGSMNINLF